MSTTTQMKPDPLEPLKAVLSGAPRDHKFLADYVRELELHRNEVDTFRRLAFENVNPGGAYGGTGTMMVSVFSQMYEPLTAPQKTEIRQWWHELVRREAEASAGLKSRLDKLA
jgi:hypothetical protein